MNSSWERRPLNPPLPEAPSPDPHQVGYDAAQQLRETLAALGLTYRGVRAGIPAVDRTPMVHTEDLPADDVLRLVQWIKEHQGTAP